MMKKCLLLICLPAMLSVSAWTEPQKKLILSGWMIPRNLEYWQIPAEKIEKGLPFDGIGISVELDIIRNGKSHSYWTSRNRSTSPLRLKLDDFKEWIDTFCKLKFSKLKHNFIVMSSSQFSQNWFDDKAWEKTINNHTVLAKLAKRIGFKGLMFDPEGYPFTGRPFVYRPELGKSVAETEAKVRERGAQWIKALAEAYPDITLFCYIWAGDIFGRYRDRQESDTLYESLFLFRAFINGVYDAVPETVKIIDANEDFGYRAADKAQIDAIAADYRIYPHRVIYPENRAKFLKHTSLAYAFYINSYIPGKKPPYNIWKTTDNQLLLLQENLAHAFKRADEYVWIWGDRGTFFPQFYPGHRYKPFEKQLPFITQAISAGKDPIGTAKLNAGKNLLKNSSMEPEKDRIPHWSKWQNKGDSKGTIAPANGGALIRNLARASFNQRCDEIRPGAKYLLTAKVKTTGTLLIPTLGLNFYDHKNAGQWHLTVRAAFGAPDKDGWRHAALIAQVPADGSIKYVSVNLSGRGPDSGSDAQSSCLFDDVELKEVMYPWYKK